MSGVLIVEDEGIVAKDLERTLERLGYCVAGIAASGDEAIDQAERLRPELVLMDINLRGAHDGVETAALIGERLAVPIVYLTAYTDDATIERAKRTLPFGYLVKPFDERALRSAVEIALHRHDVEERRALRERLSTVGGMAAGLAHELNNPLSFVVANTEFARQGLAELGRALERDAPLERLANQAQVALGEAQEGIERVRRIVRDLKTFSRLDESRIAVVDPRHVVEAALQLTVHQARGRAVVEIELGDAPPVLVNEARLGQVLVHLILNAAQAIPDGQAALHRIRIATATDERGRAVIEVADSGHGAGRGETVCDALVRALGGELEVAGAARTFRVLLPPAPSEPARDPAPPAARARRGRILVVDDERLCLSAVKRILGSEHELTLSGSGSDALARVRAGERFDAVVCDVMMPDLSGPELADELAELAPDLVERMVFVTGGAFTVHAQEFLAGRARRLLDKPLEADQLRAALQEILGRDHN
jgi:CheY-like chemotaxis protein